MNKQNLEPIEKEVEKKYKKKDKKRPKMKVDGSGAKKLQKIITHNS